VKVGCVHGGNSELLAIGFAKIEIRFDMIQAGDIGFLTDAG
jgi:hypothetical protein